MPSKHRALTLMQASESAPTLGRLIALSRETAACLEAITPAIPPSLREAVRAGPLDGATWCLLVGNTSAAAKMRQLLPTFIDLLQLRGHAVTAIRLKIQVPT